MATATRYIPNEAAFKVAHQRNEDIGVIVFHDDYYQRETAEWVITPFEDAAELFAALQGPGNTDLPWYDRITFEGCDDMGCTTLDTITKGATNHAAS